jgi:hypothetical protein
VTKFAQRRYERSVKRERSEGANLSSARAKVEDINQGLIEVDTERLLGRIKKSAPRRRAVAQRSGCSKHRRAEAEIKNIIDRQRTLRWNIHRGTASRTYCRLRWITSICSISLSKSPG